MKKTLGLFFLLSFHFIAAQITEPVPAIQEQPDDKVYLQNELTDNANYPGGIEKFMKYVGNNYKIPDEPNLNGTVISEFIIEKDGSLTNLKIIQDVGFGTDVELIRILNTSEKWKPGMIDGKPVRSYWRFPLIIHSEP